MKKITIIIFVLLSITEFNFPQNWFPLEVGNRWQYLKVKVHNNPPDYDVSYSLEEISIDKDTLINKNRYFWFSKPASYVSDWIRYSTELNKIFIWWANQENVYMDFNKQIGDTLNQFGFSHIEDIAYIIGGNVTLFSNTSTYKGFRTIHSEPMLGTSSYETSFTENIGWFEFYSDYNAYYSWGHTDSFLIMAFIKDTTGNTIYLSDFYKPIISLEPILVTQSMLFKLNVYVGHTLNRSPYFSFLDSVQMESFYQKGDSIIHLTLKNRVGSLNGEYSFVSILDTLRMKNGYSFNYRIIAKDKSLIPETAISPDSGYYKCVWDEGTGIKDQSEVPFNFSLSQNYPNPFNPSTKISWQSPVGSHQTLKVYDVLGNEVATLVDEYRNAGSYEVKFDGSNLSSGVYFYQIKAGSFVQTKKMILIK